MTKDQFEHYSKGGLFKALYWPSITHDLESGSKMYIGQTLIVYPNIVMSPILEETYNNQFRFNAAEIYGWFPEEDIKDLEIMDEYMEDRAIVTPQHLYQIVYTTKEKLVPNFGKGYEDKPLPFKVYREYSHPADDYVRKLSDPPADELYKYVWQGAYKELIKWKPIDIKP